MRDIYTLFFTYHHLLPDMVGKQNPWILFKMLDSLKHDDDISGNNHLEMFYGR